MELFLPVLRHPLDTNTRTCCPDPLYCRRNISQQPCRNWVQHIGPRRHRLVPPGLYHHLSPYKLRSVLQQEGARSGTGDSHSRSTRSAIHLRQDTLLDAVGILWRLRVQSRLRIEDSLPLYGRVGGDGGGLVLHLCRASGQQHTATRRRFNSSNTWISGWTWRLPRKQAWPDFFGVRGCQCSWKEGIEKASARSE